MVDFSNDAKLYKEELKYNPSDSDNYERLGAFYTDELHLPHVGIKYFKKAISLDKSVPVYYYELALAEKSIKHISNSIRNMEHAVALSPNNDDYYNQLGLLCSHKDAKYALKYYKQAILLDGTVDTYYTNAALAELDLKNYKASLKYMKHDLDIFTPSRILGLRSEIYNSRGLKYSSKKDYANAVKCFKSAIDIQKISTYYYNLAMSEISLQHKSKALHYIKRGVKVNPKDKGCIKLLNSLQDEYNQAHNKSAYNCHINYVKELNSLIGLNTVKGVIKRYLNRAIIHKIRTGKHGHGEIHLILEGNPGTGKTTVAKLLCGILYQKHIINKKKFVLVNSTQLINKHYGESAKAIRKIIKKAMGGVLFIDEAYHLAHRTDGNSACQDEMMADFLPEIEKHRNNLVVIMAGYTDRMERFLRHCNPGLGSRFPDRIKFPDYSNAECIKIFKSFLSKGDLTLKSNTTKKLLDKDLNNFFTANRANTNHKFSNARTVRNVYSRLVDAFSSRLLNKYSQTQLKSFKKRNYKLMNTINTADVIHAFKKFNSKRHDQNAIQALSNLIGLRNVKSLIKDYVNQTIVHKIRTGNTNNDVMNMVFEGDPGTGKTTVAKLFCHILFQKGITKSPNFVYTSATNLQSKWIGQGAKNVRKAFYKAKNGVLFIDEAYGLNNYHNASIVNQLVSEISKYKNKIVVILAGYRNSMERFLNDANDGLSSRFPNRIQFNDYDNNECLNILKYNLSKNSLRISSTKAKRVLASKFKSYISIIKKRSGKHFANARTVNNYFKCLCHVFDNRISHYPATQLLRWRKNNNERINTINLNDINKNNHHMVDSMKLIDGHTSEYDETSIGFKINSKLA